MLIPTNHRAYNSVRHFIFGQMLTKRRNNFNATLNTKKKAYFEHLPHFKKKQPAYFANTERRIFTHFQHLGPDQMNDVVMSKDWHQVLEKLESSKSHIFNVKSKRRRRRRRRKSDALGAFKTYSQCLHTVIFLPVISQEVTNQREDAFLQLFRVQHLWYFHKWFVGWDLSLDVKSSHFSGALCQKMNRVRPLEPAHSCRRATCGQ